jgi:hypothetical protein
MNNLVLSIDGHLMQDPGFELAGRFVIYPSESLLTVNWTNRLPLSRHFYRNKLTVFYTLDHQSILIGTIDLTKTDYTYTLSSDNFMFGIQTQGELNYDIDVIENCPDEDLKREFGV